MVKRHNPRQPGRRRLPSTPEAVVMPVDRPETVAAAAEPPPPESREPDGTATSVPALLSADAAPEGGRNMTDLAEVPHADVGPMRPVPEFDEPEFDEPEFDEPEFDEPTPALVALQTPPDLDEVPLVFAATQRRQAAFVPTALASAGATFQAFLLNEGLAALAHWRALARVRSPAEAIRLHFDEMQRAADSSLTCMGRIAGHVGRFGAAGAA